MKLALLCIFAAGIAATYAHDCEFDGAQCVEIYSGPAPSTPHFEPPVDCGKCRADAVALSITDMTFFVPECNAENQFAAYQYDASKDESFCYDAYGKEQKGSRVEGKGAVCQVVTVAPPPAPKPNPCAAKTAELEAGNPYNLVLSCNDEGFYNPVQCSGAGYCWCTQVNGALIPNTFHATGTQFDCAHHLAIVPACKKTDELIPYPGDCARYFSCSPSGTYTCTCGPNQRFDHANQKCDWAENVLCPRGY